MMNIPSFSSGERLSAAKLNALADAVRELQREAAASRITSVNGGTFSRTAGGTTLDVRRAAPPQVPTQQTAADRDHPFKVTLLPPNEDGGRHRVKVSIGKAYKQELYSSVSYLTPAFVPGSQGYLGGNMAELPAGATGLYVAVGAQKAGVAFDTYEQNVGDEQDVVFRGKVNGWHFFSAGLFFDTEINTAPALLGAERVTRFYVASFSRQKNEADGTETVSVRQELFSDIFIPDWVPDEGRIQSGWL